VLRKRRPAPATLHICRDRPPGWLAGLVSFTMSASTPPTASRRWDWDWGRLPAVADQPQMEAEGWNPVLLAACWRVWQRQVQVRIRRLAPTATCLLPPTPGVRLPERCCSPRSNSLLLSRRRGRLPRRRYQYAVPAAVASGCPVAVHPTLPKARVACCGTAECIQDASLGDGCWLVAVSFVPSDPSRTRR
jgi:hypothetical protein